MRLSRHPPPHATLLACAALGLGAIIDSAACAQQSNSAQPLPPQILLGRRAESVRQTIKTIPILVIVDSPAAYVQIVAEWTLAGRFPVLIDDGSDETAEHIARFVRGFKPQQVVRWIAPEDIADRLALPEDKALRRELIQRAALATWGAGTPEQQLEIWEQTGFAPPGVVVASPHDPAWTAALALAAARGQPIIWSDLEPQSPSGFMQNSALAALDELVTDQLKLTGDRWSWRELGDDIDALTLCVSQPTKFRESREVLAVTDRLGRHDDASRWGWCGMIFGSEALAAYRAMSSIFIQPTSAWLFDGYKEDFAPPYAIAPAANYFEQAKLRISTNFPPHGGLDQWRSRTDGGVQAGLIFVNTQGFARWFMLNPGRARSGDVPFLHVPAAVVFVHSFSAQRVGDFDSIAGRWLDRGALAFYGSCDEPTLAGFVPNHLVAARMLSGGALGACVRHDSGRGARVWKLNLIGDPLFSIGAPAPRTEAIPEMHGTTSVEDEMRTALGAGDLASGVRSLVMLGRDQDAVRLARAALGGEGERMTPRLAGLAIRPALRAGEPDLVAELYERLRDVPELAERHRDALWHAARPLLARAAVDERLIELLQSATREESADDDAQSIAPHLSRLRGKPAVRAMYTRLISEAQDAEIQRWLEDGLRSW